MNKIILSILLLICCSCKKFLDVIPDESWKVPSDISDLQQLLDHYKDMNTKYPVAAEEHSDNYFIEETYLLKLPRAYRNFYLWQKEDSIITSWAYEPVQVANEVLASYEKMSIASTGQAAANNVKGSALFFRAYYFYGLAQLYAPVFDEKYADLKNGILLKTDTDDRQQTNRSTLRQTYYRIIMDLLSAADLLPVKQSINTRPNKAAAFGALSKVYLSMKDYSLAGQYADSCLRYYPELMDYNYIDTTAAKPFVKFKNPEVVFHMVTGGSPLLSSMARADSNLYRSYAADDLRKCIFFRHQGYTDNYSFKGDYDGTGNPVMAGIVTDEMYLIRAECYARNGRTIEALKDLNKLLETRWKKGTFIPFHAASAKDALYLILQERRKELVWRATRWTDMRRLKDEPDYRVIPGRSYGGENYVLLPISDRYTLQIPKIVISVSGIEQNP